MNKTVAGMYVVAVVTGATALWLWSWWVWSFALGAFLLGLLLGVLRGRQHRPATKTGPKAFTLVELLVVLLILALLLSLVVGISRYIMARSAEKQTEATQAVVMVAIDHYRQVKQSCPPNSADCASLIVELRTVPIAEEALKSLSTEAYAQKGGPLKDGFGEDMAYEQAGGLGGGPVLISKGPDRQTGSTETRLDDIRSDSQ